MEFTAPTTRDEMIATLKSIFYYYRIKKLTYEGLELEDLNIEKMTYTPKTDEQILAQATVLLAGNQAKVKLEGTQKLKDEIENLQNKKSELEEKLVDDKLEVNEEYQKSLKALKKQTLKNGLTNSKVAVDKAVELENSKNEKLLYLETKATNKITEITGKIATKTQELEDLEDTYADMFEKEIYAKAEELKIEQDKKTTEVFKYNNGVEEKLQRYNNNILQNQATLDIHYMELHQQGFTKSELIENGYYSDVIRCISAYYDTLTPQEALADMVNDLSLALYLDDYYEILLDALRNRINTMNL